MKLIIDIPDEDYAQLDKWSVYYFREMITNGTPLPKGHGRLIDADALEKKMCDREDELGDDRSMWESSAVSVALDMFAPTIIEADKGE